MTVTLVLDSPPLQALHRCVGLDALEQAYVGCVPTGVVSETRRSLEHEGASRVPELERHPWLRVAEVTDADLEAAGAKVLKEYRSTTRYRIGERQVDRPELEVVLLAERLSAIAVVEDKKGVLCARDRGVTVAGTADVLCDLEIRGLTIDASVLARAILATGYHTPDLRYLASGARRPAWRVALGSR